MIGDPNLDLRAEPRRDEVAALIDILEPVIGHLGENDRGQVLLAGLAAQDLLRGLF